jgi:PIN domain nuclease of toxin-antitoxin system
LTFVAVADTHTVIWYVFADARLSEKAKEAIDGAAEKGLYIGVSAISLAEIVYLIEKQRIAPDTLERLLSVCNDPGKVLAEIPLDSAIVQKMSDIPRSVGGVKSVTAIAHHIFICSRNQRHDRSPFANGLVDGRAGAGP